MPLCYPSQRVGGTKGLITCYVLASIARWLSTTKSLSWNNSLCTIVPLFFWRDRPSCQRHLGWVWATEIGAPRTEFWGLQWLTLISLASWEILILPDHWLYKFFRKERRKKRDLHPDSPSSSRDSHKSSRSLFSPSKSLSRTSTTPGDQAEGVKGPLGLSFLYFPTIEVFEHFFVPYDWFSGKRDIVCALTKRDVMLTRSGDLAVIRGGLDHAEKVSIE